MATQSSKRDAIPLEAAGPDGSPIEVRLASPDRALGPAAGVTQRELAEYAITVSEPFLRANGDRPVSLQRYGDTVEGEWFFSKNPPKGAPPFVKAETVTYPSGRRHPQVVLDSAAATVWAVQMNTVTFHPWPSRSGNTDNPDQLRIDLDPQPGTGFAEAVPAAIELRAVLEEAGLESYVKTSGN